ncbi:hypothetical protein AMJ85_06310 [candidate division BRC1 bacterium SM23_51]|nr:MAG: hypothetical protein AMJ85_06310 [candidate division BRC1 bacterium SM23_51]
MWRLSFFESDGFWIPEIANPPSWEGVVAFLVAVLCIWLLRLLRRASAPALPAWKTFIVVLPFGIPALFGILTGLFDGNISGLNFFVLIGLGYLVYTIIVIVALCRRFRERGGVSRIFLALLLSAIFVLSLVCYQMSYPYYLPASYPEPERSQLRMLRRLIELERGDDQRKAKMIPLSEAHLTCEGNELIPDSIRENGRYGVYEYTLHFDIPCEGLFTIDAVPIEAKERLPSFHVFPTNPETLDERYSYVVYCITMARRTGEPATEDDPHFHRRSMFKILLQRWQRVRRGETE